MYGPASGRASVRLECLGDSSRHRLHRLQDGVIVIALRDSREQLVDHQQQALQILIGFNARYEQASTYHQLGVVAQEQRQWKQAKELFGADLKITREFNDMPRVAMTLRSIARLWQERTDASLVAEVASILGMSHEEVESLLRPALLQAANGE